MAYQISKAIGACATVLKGKVDAIILTGGIAFDKEFVEWIKKVLALFPEFFVYPGEFEMIALTQGVLRVLNGDEKPKEYKG